MSIDSLSDLFKLPGAEEIRQWEEQRKEIAAAIKQLQEKTAYLDRLIAAARGEPVPSPISVPGKNAVNLKPGTWMHAVAEVVFAHPEGVAYADIRAKLQGRFAEQVRRHPRLKAFYGALRRLEAEEVIVRHRNHAFTPSGYKRYLNKLARGDVTPVHGHDYRQSPMGDAIMQFMREHGPSKVAPIRDYLSSHPQFQESMKNHSAIYNVLRRFVDRGELIHDKSSAVYSLPNENGAPAATPHDAPDAGEVGASPIETQPSLRLVR